MGYVQTAACRGGRAVSVLQIRTIVVEKIVMEVEHSLHMISGQHIVLILRSVDDTTAVQLL